ncbi:molybdate transport system ATP-binding protein [Mucilaginibacter yixingensis]|uniref:Molybdate transport system ATP-binding protein n=1 Tax=Mucilaginibacter yixingensis TaxID=1295612 RepID=A0A2T5JAZ8_9SPHI|nr:ATP-binding cassette domain-containing protein [Mucilaginibacter yixingensis]PTQ98036.1 molybdate transport system ATP-binding protein [Mucilaginibacter yixingensis]
MPVTPYINISNAGIGYMGNNLLNNVNLQIEPGQHWAIVGASGSGKTTLLQAIAGNLQLRSGTVERNLTDYQPETTDYHQLIAFVSSRHHFRNLSNTTEFYYQQRYNSSDSEDALTVQEYLESVNHQTPVTHGWTADRAIDLMQLKPLADKQLIKLSNGETKRLMIAAALMKNPLLLLLDNPLAGLDIETRGKFSSIINLIASTGIGIVMVTSATEIPDAITHIAMIKNGSVTETDKNTFNADAFAEHEQGIFKADITPLLDHYPAQPFDYMVRMRNVTIRYGEKVILDNVNWEIKQGERWALLGHNGAGKSTLLSLINGDNPQAYANDIMLFDKKRGSGESIWDIKKKTGFISPELFQYFPAESNCLQAIESGYFDTVGLFRPSDKEKAARAMEWMKLLEIDKYAHKLLKYIPASAQRLCLLARAMIKNPALLILDEPCQGLDEHQQQYFKELVDAICAKTNISLIYVTHYTHQIPQCVDKALKLEGGRVV